MVGRHRPFERAASKARTAVWRVRIRGEAMTSEMRECRGELAARAEHCSSPKGVRIGSGRARFATEIL